MELFIYCSGSIIKGATDTKKLVWTDKERGDFSLGANPYNVVFLNPEDPVSDLSNSKALFGRDMYQVKLADAVVVDARERRGIGIGVEMLASRVLGSALIIVAPNNTYYRMSNVTYRGGTVEDYVHPHLASLADAVVDDFQSAGAWLRKFKEAKGQPKQSNVLQESIQEYTTHLLDSDPPMLEAIKRVQGN